MTIILCNTNLHIIWCLVFFCCKRANVAKISIFQIYASTKSLVFASVSVTVTVGRPVLLVTIAKWSGDNFKMAKNVSLWHHRSIRIINCTYKYITIENELYKSCSGILISNKKSVPVLQISGKKLTHMS